MNERQIKKERQSRKNDMSKGRGNQERLPNNSLRLSLGVRLQLLFSIISMSNVMLLWIPDSSVVMSQDYFTPNNE